MGSTIETLREQARLQEEIASELRTKIAASQEIVACFKHAATLKELYPELYTRLAEECTWLTEGKTI